MRRLLAFALFLVALPLISMGGATEAAQSPCTGVQGIDISNYQPGADLNQAAANGVQAVYVEEGDGSFISPTFSQQTTNARIAGLPWGAYWFAEPNSNPASAQLYALSFVLHGGASGILPPALDTEVSNGLSSQQVAAFDEAWIAAVNSLSHRPVVVYTGEYPWASYLSAYPLWVAAYPQSGIVNSACGLPLPALSPWVGWQYTGSGSVPGVGLTDRDVFEPAWFANFTGYQGGAIGPGAIGPAVLKLQQELHVPQTGVYDDATTQAVAKLQVLLGVPSDGTWGPVTEGALLRLLAHVPRPHGTLRAGQHGHGRIATLQTALNATGAHLKVTDWYGTPTVEAVAKFKGACHLGHNGRVFGAKARTCLNFVLTAKGK